MIKKLKDIIKGELLTDEESLRHYSQDGSIFKMIPKAVMFPKSKNDIIELVKHINEDEDPIPIVSRGKGTDLTGGPLGEGIVVRFPGYIDKILEIGGDFARVEAGVIFGDLEKELDRIGRFVPPYPASKDFCTIGGSVANNAGGEKTVKYGAMRDYVKNLKVVLYNGDEIETAPLNEEELNKKMSQSDVEGEIYRKIYNLLKDNRELIASHIPQTTKNASGYALWRVIDPWFDAPQENIPYEAKKSFYKDRNNKYFFDLGQLFCGSQGTLGIITEATLKTIPKPKESALTLAFFDSLDKAGKAIIKSLELKPASVEMVDKYFIEVVEGVDPKKIKDVIPLKKPEVVLFIGFDGDDVEEIKQKMHQTKINLKSLAYETREAYNKEQQDELWKLRRSAALVIEHLKGKKQAIPFIEDSTVSPGKLPEYLSEIYEIFEEFNIKFAVWGHGGNGDLHIRPLIDLSDEQDRAKVFKIADKVFTAVAKFSGSVAGEHSDGLVRAPFLERTFGKEMIGLFREVKKIFDPRGIFNPNKKFDVSVDYLNKYLRKDYNVFKE